MKLYLKLLFGRVWHILFAYISLVKAVYIAKPDSEQGKFIQNQEGLRIFGKSSTILLYYVSLLASCEIFW